MYTEDQCNDYMKTVRSVGYDGLLQIYRLSHDPLSHVKRIHQTVTGSPNITGDGIILDAGCGTGGFLHLLSLHRAASEYVGVNKFMCQLPEARRWGSNMLFYDGDIADEVRMEAIAKELEGPVSYAYCNYTIGHLEYKGLWAMFHSFYNMLREDGRVGIWDMVPATIECDTVLDYHLWEPDVLCSVAEQSGFATRGVQFYEPWDYEVGSTFKKLVTKEQRKVIKHLAKPVLYVFEIH